MLQKANGSNNFDIARDANRGWRGQMADAPTYAIAEELLTSLP
ncbi:MAG TPA: hypothetical protein VKV39_14135 [Candidatus Sulfotelmatobacter sp.]|nr:hypothetical protein [Candidatus Sulfotelmatobacter sp.]